MRRTSTLTAWLAASFLLACAPEGPAPASTPRRAPDPGSASRPSAATQPPPAGLWLKRSEVDGVLTQGLGSFLRHVEVEDRPVFGRNGAFRGFRIAALRDAAFWRGVDLKPGDVVTSVNGFPIERPEQAQVAFDSLQVSSELRVAYERDGAPRELVYAIVSGR